MFEAILSFIAAYVLTKMIEENSKKVKELPKINASKKDILQFSLYFMSQEINKKIRNNEVPKEERDEMAKDINIMNTLMKDKEMFPNLEKLRFNKSIQLLEKFKKYL